MCKVELTCPVSTLKCLAAQDALQSTMCSVRAGYIGSASLLRTIVRLVELLRQQNPGLMYGAC